MPGLALIASPRELITVREELKGPLNRENLVIQTGVFSPHEGGWVYTARQTRAIKEFIDFVYAEVTGRGRRTLAEKILTAKDDAEVKAIYTRAELAKE